MIEHSIEQLNNNGDKRGMHPNSRKNLKPHWQKGQSGNPQGKLCLTDLLKKELQQVIDYIVPGLPPNKEKLTSAQLIVKALVLAGVKGKMDAVEKIFDRVEGKVTQPISGEGGEPIKTEIIVSSQTAKNFTNAILNGKGT